MNTDTAVERKCPSCPDLPWCTEHDCCPWDCWDFTNDRHKPAPAAS